MATQALINSATEAQQGEYLPMIAAGECRFAVALPSLAGQTGAATVQLTDDRLTGAGVTLVSGVAGISRASGTS